MHVLPEVLSRFWFTTGVWGSRINATQIYATKAVLWSSTTRLCFSTEALIVCHLGMPHRQFTPCVWYPSIHNPWACTSQRRALSKRINSPPPNRYIFNRNQSHRIKSNARHKVHLQVRSGSEWNQRHFPRISVDFQVRLDDLQLIPSSWVYIPIKIVRNQPNEVKTPGLQPPSSPSTYRRIGYSKWV